MTSINRALATAFGLGHVPLAPGTAASAAAVLAYVLLLHRLPWPFYTALVILLFFLGIVASARTAAELGRPDPGLIVIDEVCGQLIAAAFLPVGWLPAVVSFVLFRFFDIIKPWPIRRLERLTGGWGIMADDAAAGLAAALLARLVLLVV
jgi:phosphatidylglycerophosphatase A